MYDKLITQRTSGVLHQSERKGTITIMKKNHILLLTFGLWLAVLLTACQSGGVSALHSTSDKIWNKAISDSSIRDYVKKHMDELDMAELEKEAEYSCLR